MIQNQDNGEWTIESIYDFIGWEILSVEPWKKNTVRVHMRKVYNEANAVFRMVYSPLWLVPRDVIQHLKDQGEDDEGEK